MIRYFVPKKQTLKKRAHLWTGRETVCRLSSTGGLNPRRYMVADDPGERELCLMCETVFAKDKRKVVHSNAKRVTWGESWDDVFEPANRFRGI